MKKSDVLKTILNGYGFDVFEYELKYEPNQHNESLDMPGWYLVSSHFREVQHLGYDFEDALDTLVRYADELIEVSKWYALRNESNLKELNRFQKDYFIGDGLDWKDPEPTFCPAWWGITCAAIGGIVALSYVLILQLF